MTTPNLSPEVRVLKAINTSPGLNGVRLAARHHLSGATMGRLHEMERRQLIVYRSDGWHLTGKGDAILAEELADGGR